MTDERETIRDMLHEALEAGKFIVEREGGCLRIHFAGNDIGIAVFEYPDIAHRALTKPLRVCGYCNALIEHGMGRTEVCCCETCKKQLMLEQKLVDAEP